ncbi:MAG: PEP-CTERM sorting domain-containing protein [Phenylobacterium sp.]|nr:PEP-CTERM sorting domain-containing protein [Phenylobacterium sp.]
MGEPWNPPGGSGGGAFARAAQNSGRGYDQAYNFAVSITSARITEVGAVPEPAAWSLMIAGFGAAGAVLRRRRLARAA